MFVLNYLLGKDRDRFMARILSGSEAITAALIDSSDYKQKYFSGCLSFAEADIPLEQKQYIMQAFEKMLFAGLETDQYNILWIEHRDKNRLELNFLIPQIELRSSRRLQVYYDKVDRARFDAFQSFINAKFDFADPDDPLRGQLLTRPRDISVDDFTSSEKITKFITRHLKQGTVSTRGDIINLLNSLDLNVVRTTNRSISIKHPKLKRNIRLKGDLYNKDFDIRTFKQQKDVLSQLYKDSRETRAEFSKQKLLKLITAKAEYNRHRYQKGGSEDGQVNQCTSFIQEVKRKLRQVQTYTARKIEGLRQQNVDVRKQHEHNGHESTLPNILHKKKPSSRSRRKAATDSRFARYSKARG